MKHVHDKFSLYTEQRESSTMQRMSNKISVGLSQKNLINFAF